MNLLKANSKAKDIIATTNNCGTHAIEEYYSILEDRYQQNGFKKEYKKGDVWENTKYGKVQILNLYVLDLDSYSSSINYGYSYNGSIKRPEAPAGEIVIVFIDKEGICYPLSANDIDYTWMKVSKPDMFWENNWAKAIHDLRDDYRSPTIMSSYGGVSEGDEVMAELFPPDNTRCKVIKIAKFGSGDTEEIKVLLGALEGSNVTHRLNINNVKKNGKTAAVDKDMELMLKFFSTSQHDKDNPWRKK